MKTEEIAALLNASLLLPVAIKSAEEAVNLTSKTSPYRAEKEAELEAAKARYDAENLNRELRAKAKSKGFQLSQYKQGQWVKKTASGWVNATVEEAAAAIASEI